jgi:acetate kinase
VTIEARAAGGRRSRRLAVTVFAHRVRKYVGAYAAVLGGLDAVVLTGGIGENSATMRRRILQRLDFLGVSLDEDRNADARVSDAAPVFDISASSARAKTLVIATNEELQIAREAADVASKSKVSASARPIPIAISARHVHLDRAAMDALFGPGSELTPAKPLSQPGQYAAEERVTVIGPRGRLERVRVLGPLRQGLAGRGLAHRRVRARRRCAHPTVGPHEGLGADHAGGAQGDAAAGEGLICAWRHIHMHPTDAERYGVEGRRRGRGRGERAVRATSCSAT